ncbi:FimD/PapC C-terminal domain-containing protein [Burkholderia lata]|uniref:FimD/PapC C-terminal domain-containing protein n=1 Tax=Burkholderia lata (strain ATCC 17760 / DSM 23089 / LMG 22485 / NCIMB 9086 / R18194 / 383) TaxID=482957 RepID=UPI0034A0C9C8
MVSDAQGQALGTVGQGGKLFVRGLEETGTLTAKWGNRSTEMCSLSYRMPVQAGKREIYTRIDSTCDYGVPTTSKPSGSTAHAAQTKKRSDAISTKY